MNFYDTTFLASVASLLITVLYIFITGAKYIKEKNRDSKHILSKYFPLLVVICIITGVIGLNYYYTRQIEKENEKYQQLLNKQQTESIVINEQKTRVLDSLETYRQELLLLIGEMKKQQFITGENTKRLTKANVILEQTDKEINKIKTYNEVVSETVLLQIDKGYFSSGNSSSIIFKCPSDTVSDFIDLQFRFANENLIDKVAFIYVEVVRLDSSKNYTSFFRQGYKPKNGINTIGIQNYLKQPNMELNVGYFLNSELQKETPRIEKITCKSIKKNKII